MPRNSRRRIAALAAGVVTTLALGAGTAQAFDYAAMPDRQPGWVSAHSVGVATASSDIFAQGLTSAGIGFDSLWLYPSPGSAQTQIVTVRNTIRECGVTSITDTRIADQCQTAGSSADWWYIKPGDWTWISNRSPLNFEFSPSQGWTYYPRLTITWYTLSGAYLGQKIINYRDAGDGRCASAQCSWFGYGAGGWVYGFTNN